MSIFATDTPMHPDDREAWWVSMKRAYLNNERAVNHFAVLPLYRINLATKTRKCLTTHPQAGLPHQCAATGPDFATSSNEQQQSGPRLVLQVALAALGWVGLLALAFAFVVLLGLRMGAI